MKSIFVSLLFVVLLAGCDRATLDATLETLPLSVSSGESFAPQLEAANGKLVLSWLEADDAGHALRYAVWEGSRWGEPRTIARGDNWFANWADLPGVKALADGSWLAWWLQKSGQDTYAYDVQLAVSEDGHDWRRIGTPHQDGTQTEHGFVSAFDLPDGDAGLVWLDGRRTLSEGHGHHGGEMTLRYGRIKDATVKEAELDDRVCDCCQTDSAWAGDALVLVYRDRSPDEVRDIRAQRLVEGRWAPAVLVHEDGWKIEGCPVNGPAVAADGQLVAVAWFTAPMGKGSVRLALSHDGGRTFSAPLRVDDGNPEGRVDVVVHPHHGVLASWVERTATGGEVRLRRISRDGQEKSLSTTLAATSTERASGFPRLAVAPDGAVLMAWTATESGRALRTARLALDQ